jgi:hypothetical protein
MQTYILFTKLSTDLSYELKNRKRQGRAWMEQVKEMIKYAIELTVMIKKLSFVLLYLSSVLSTNMILLTHLLHIIWYMLS